jgi:Caspase domain
MPARRALVVGINAYPHVPPLSGCVNDARLMHNLLVDSFGFPEDQVTLLTDDQATRDGILAAFDAMVAATGPDDIVVVHYAGHGSQIADREGDEPSGLDSTIVPFDARQPGGDLRDITDDEIHLRIEALARQTPFTTLIVDACHSGTVTRDDFGESARSIAPDTRPASALPPSPIPLDRRQSSRTTGPSGWMPLTDKYVLIAGCRDDEQSYEYRPPEGAGAVVHGALTYFLCQQLRRAAGTLSYRDVFERAAAQVNAANPLQHPQMEGRADREVFGVGDLAPAPYVRVVEREDDAVLLAAGAAHGMTAGSTFRVFPHGAREPQESGSLGEVEVLEVQSVTSLARITREDSSARIVPEARAFEIAHDFGDQRLTVDFAAPGDEDSHSTSLRTLIGASRLVAPAAPAQPASARIHRLAARDVATSSSPVPQVGALAEPRWAVVGVSGDLLMPLAPLDDPATVVQNLERLAKFRQALAIENPDPASRLRGRFSIVLQLLSPDRKTWSEPAPSPDCGHIVFEEGDIIRIVIRTSHGAPVFVSLYDFGLSGAIGQIYPAKGAQEMLRPQGELRCQPQQLAFPSICPPFHSAASTQPVEGLETVKLFVTEQATDFSAFEQDSLRTEEPSSPLGVLLQSVFNGKVTRESDPVSLGDEDWTTVSTSFVLRRRRA